MYVCVCDVPALPLILSILALAWKVKQNKERKDTIIHITPFIHSHVTKNLCAFCLFVHECKLVALYRSWMVNSCSHQTAYVVLGYDIYTYTYAVCTGLP